MKIAELRSKSLDELKEMLGQLKKEMLNLRFQKSTGTLEKTARIREVRRDVARIQTLLSAAKNAA